MGLDDKSVDRGNAPVTDPENLRPILLETLDARTTHRGEIVMPCIPAPAEHYLARLHGFFRDLGRPLSGDELNQLRQVLVQHLEQGFRAAADAQIVIRYETTVTRTLRKNLLCQVTVAGSNPTGLYRHWQVAGEGAGEPFGAHPDARVLSLTSELGEPRSSPILDIGAGNGRNAKALAQLGFPVDAIEPTPQFAKELRQIAQTHALPIQVLEADIFDPKLALKPGHYRLILLAEVLPHFRSPAQVRTLLMRAADWLGSAGLLLGNAFLTIDGYEPDPLARQVAEVAWSCLLTRQELAEALAGLPFTLLADESVLEYEKAHLPASAWPPTPWFEAWASGRSAFQVKHGRPPAELRWLLLRRL